MTTMRQVARGLLSTSTRSPLLLTRPLVRPFSCTHGLLQAPAAAVPSSSPESATSKAERTLRRFWKRVDVAYHSTPQSTSHLRVRLDGRPLKTPSGSVLEIPADRPLLAAVIAKEWAEQERILRPHSLPLTSLAARAIDGLSREKDRVGVVQELARYLDTDTICFHEDHPPVLVQLQKERWDPILAWADKRFKLEKRTKVFEGLLDIEQDSHVVDTLSRHILTAFDAWDLAAFERAVRSTKSFLVALRLVQAIQEREAAFGVEEASLAAEVEVESQTQRWGQVEDTHDVDHADARKLLGSVAIAVQRERDGDRLARQIFAHT